MALRDSLSSGESYFIVEIKSLKRILDAARDSDSKSAITSSAAPSERKDDAASQSPSPILCFIDEVLRGTNTVERIAASSEILLDLHRRGIRCFAATHDVELTSLLQGSYENYHFEEQIENGDVLFNYRLQKGAATTRNAIRLLEAIGYEEDIVKNAENRASEFIRSGEWKR
jgi:DNA mismatch repair ATPase MutS